MEDGFDIAVNVTYLGKQGLYTTADDFKIAYLSGIQSEKHTDFSFNINDIDDLINTCASAGRIDILLSSCFPYHVNEFSLAGRTNYLMNLDEHGSILVSKLAKFILPRYHFASSENEFYEREPYRNHLIMQEQPKLVTRFVSMAKVREENKPKWLYAFTLKPAKLIDKTELNHQPDDTTENPYLHIDFEDLKLIKKEKETEIFNNGSFFFANPNDRKPHNQSNRNHDRINENNIKQENRNDDLNGQATSSGSNKRSNQSNDDSADKRAKSNESSCWFCLSSPKIEKHLLISIGEHSYLGN